MTTPPTVQQIDEKILQLKQRLLALGAFHPGSLSRQYKACGKPGCKCCDPHHPRRHGPYIKLTYVRRGKFTCRFVRAAAVPEVTTLVTNFKIFRQLTEEWVALAIQRAQLGALQPTPAKSKPKTTPKPLTSTKPARQTKKAR